MKEQSISGGCYCGNIRYKAPAGTIFQVNCHCENCRRAVGAQSVAFISVPLEEFSWTKGSPTRYQTDTEAWRTFCPECGTSLTYESATRRDQIDILTASLDHPEDYPPNSDAWEEERLDWVPLVKKES